MVTSQGCMLNPMQFIIIIIIIFKHAVISFCREEKVLVVLKDLLAAKDHG